MIRYACINFRISCKVNQMIPGINQIRCLHASEKDEPNELWVARKDYFPPKQTPMMPENVFHGKVAFVTGGGTGLGAGIAKMISRLGAKVAIVSRNIDVLKNTADMISEETNNQVLPIRCDVTSTKSVRDAVSDCIDTLGLPNIIINNAAGNVISPTLRLSNDVWKAAIDVILMGTLNVTLDIGKRLISAKQGGAFLNISSTYTKSGSAFTVPAGCAKSGVECLTKSLASEWCIYGLRFNCIQPGTIKNQGFSNQDDPQKRFLNGKLPRLPLGRLGEIEEVANLACYLVSDYSSWMTGNIIKLDGGEFNFAAGTFNRFIENVSEEEWVVVENLIKNKQKTAGEVIEQS